MRIQNKTNLSPFLLAFLFTAISSLSFAHCPNAFSHQGKDYCMDFTWNKVQRVQRGELVTLNQQSPVLNDIGVRAFRRVLSSLSLSIWNNGDKDHRPVRLEGFRVFPYMLMTDGMHHPGSSKTEFIESEGSYLVSELPFFDMEQGGCWSLRFTFSSASRISDSFKISDVFDYTNIESAKVIQLLGICEMCSSFDIEDQSESSDHNHH